MNMRDQTVCDLEDIVNDAQKVFLMILKFRFLGWRTVLSKATHVIFVNRVGLSCPWLDRVFVSNQTSNCL